MIRVIAAAALFGGACATAAADHERLGDRAYREGRYADAIAELVAAQVILPRNIQAAGLQRVRAFGQGRR